MIKPDAVAAGHTEEILSLLEIEGFRILAPAYDAPVEVTGRGLLRRASGAAFFSSLVKFMTSGPLIVMALEREDTITKLREIMGCYRPRESSRRDHSQALRRIDSDCRKSVSVR